jgi:hypothetical protein
MTLLVNKIQIKWGRHNHIEIKKNKRNYKRNSESQFQANKMLNDETKKKIILKSKK